MTAPITLTPTAAQMREVHAVTRFEPSRSVGFVIHHDRHGVDAGRLGLRRRRVDRVNRHGYQWRRA